MALHYLLIPPSVVGWGVPPKTPKGVSTSMYSMRVQRKYVYLHIGQVHIESSKEKLDASWFLTRGRLQICYK
jgi:hypothetical protein